MRRRPLRHIFIPPEKNFMGYLVQQVKLVQEGLKVLADFMESGDFVLVDALRAVEREGDETRRILVNELNGTFVTPIDREDLHALSRALDDLLDYGYRTIKEMAVYKSRLEDDEGTPRVTLATCNADHYTGPVNAYFVRHAESQYNALNKHQVASVGLSDLGIEQAKCVAQRLATKNIDAILSSSYERARQTAEFISAAVQKPIELTPLLAELKRPSVIEGRHHDDPEAVGIKSAIIENLHDPAWRYADEETFFDARDRAIRCITFITHLDKSNVLLVTHGGILRMILAVMLHGKEVGAGDFLKLQEFMRVDNASITLCEYTGDRGWDLITWNDCAHLECLADLSSSRGDCDGMGLRGA